jgi:hypothetical protein
MLRTEVPVYEGVVDACRRGDIANRYGGGTSSGEQLISGIEYRSHHGLAALRSRVFALAYRPIFLARFWRRPKYARTAGAWRTIHRFVPLSSHDPSAASASAVKCLQNAALYGRIPSMDGATHELRRSLDAG